jgi:hypothetical protein
MGGSRRRIQKTKGGRLLLPRADPSPVKLSATPTVTYLEAIRQGIWEEMERNPSVFCIGEDIGIYGGAFKVTDGAIVPT